MTKSIYTSFRGKHAYSMLKTNTNMGTSHCTMISELD